MDLGVGLGLGYGFGRVLCSFGFGRGLWIWARATVLLAPGRWCVVPITTTLPYLRTGGLGMGLPSGRFSKVDAPWGWGSLTRAFPMARVQIRTGTAYPHVP